MWSVKYDFASISYGTWLNKQKRGLTTCGCDIWVVREAVCKQNLLQEQLPEDKGKS